MKNAQKMTDKRVSLVKEARNITDLATKETRELTGEESEKFDKIMKDVDNLKVSIDREVRMEAEEKSLNEVVTEIVTAPVEKMENRGSVFAPQKTPEFKNSFDSYLRRGKNSLVSEELRSLQVGSTTEGGYLVHDSFLKGIVNIMEVDNVVRGLSTKIRTSGGSYDIPIVSSHGEAVYGAEESEYTESDEVFGQKVLSSRKLKTLIKISEELLQDASFSLEGYLQKEIGRRFAEGEEVGFTTGSSPTGPNGFVADTTSAVTAAATGAVVWDEIISLHDAVKPGYQRRGTWLMNQSTLSALRKLRTTASTAYIWAPAVLPGTDDRILGKPLKINAAMASMESGVRAITFGDMSYYWIADRMGIAIQRLNELYAANGQIGFRAYTRNDGILTQTEAVKCITMQ